MKSRNKPHARQDAKIEGRSSWQIGRRKNYSTS